MMEELFDKSGRYLDSVKRHFDQQEKKLDESMEMVDDHVASLEQDTRQRRLSMEADGAADIKTHERTEGAATAVQAMHGDSCSANRVHLDPMCSTSFGDDGTGPPAFPCSREKTLVNNGATAPKSCLILNLTLRDTRTDSRRWLTPHRQNLYSNEDHLRPPNSLVLPNRRDKFEDFDSIHLVLQQLRVDKQPQAPFWPKVIETKSGQNRMFDSGGSRSSPRLSVFGNLVRVALWGG